MKDVDTLNMWMIKMNAHSDKYFQLFEKYIGKFNRCLLAFIGNETVISNIIKTNPKAEYMIFDNILIKDTLAYTGLDLSRTTFISDIQDFFKVIDNMPSKFDKIIMNPPYSKNLHLQILAKAIEHLDENGTCVNLSPVRWLQDPLAKYKKTSDYKRFEESVAKHIKEVKVISALDSQLLFGNVMNFNLGIYECISKKTNFDMDSLIDKITLKIFNKMTSFPKIESNMQDGVRVRIPLITGGESNGSGKRKVQLRSFGKLLYFIDGMKDGKPWFDYYMKNQYSKTTPYITSSIRFNSEIEAQNFIKQFDTSLVKYYTHNLLKDVHVFEQSFLWMSDVINPRTDKKGYESEWTDEDFYKYFGITEDEQKLIEETMEKYK